jgi:hypothetical protein
MASIDFYGLPRSVQDQLLAAFRGESEPRPLLHRLCKRSTHLAWLGASVAALLVTAALALVGFGEMHSALSRHPAPMAAAFVVLFGAVALGVAQALAYRDRVRRLPYAPGLYLFAANLIDARDHDLVVFPIADLHDAAPTGADKVTLTFGSQRFAFQVDATTREQTVQRIITVRDVRLSGLGGPDHRQLDPLEPPLVAAPGAPIDPLTRDDPMWLRLRWLSLAAAAALGLLLFWVRDNMSDTAMFAAAKQRDEVAGYKRYLDRGDDHGAEVARVLLPRAELSLAVDKGTVEAIDTFRTAYPDTDIEEEITAARRSALEAAFDKARGADNLAALYAFEARWPKHHLADRVKQAKHEVYTRALESYQGKRPSSGAQAIESLVVKLLAYAESTGPQKTDNGLRGPATEIRFRRVPSRALTRADEVIARNPYTMGDVSLPAQYFDAPHLEPAEQDAAKALAERFAKAFAPELLTFVPGKALEGAEDDPLEITQPTLVVNYRIEPSGANHVSKSPPGIWIGLVFFFTVDFHLPGESKPHRAKHILSRKVPVVLVAKHDRESPRKTLETKVYDTMVREGFAVVHKLYLARWFR